MKDLLKFSINRDTKIGFTIILLMFASHTHAQLKDSFKVDFNYPNGTVYNLQKAKRDFGSNTRWNREHNTTINNNALRVKFTKGLYGPDCGFTGATNVKPAKKRLLEYRIKFEKGFDFRKGSKLPGMGGGTTPSGGKPVDDGKGFTARSSWTKERTGLFNIYSYYFDKKAPKYGDNWNSNFVFKANKWYKVKMEIKINTGSNKNGYCKAWVDGKLVLQKNNVRWMTKGHEVDEVSFSIFMGGNNQSFSPDHTQYLWVDYIKVTNLDNQQGNKKPNVNLTFPRDKQEFRVGQEISLKATASDPDGSVRKVDFHVNNKLYSTDPGNPYDRKFKPTKAGTYKISAIAFDNKNATSEDYVTVIVKNGTANPPSGNCNFGTPSTRGIANLETSYDNVFKIGNGGPDTRNIRKFSINYSAAYNKLYKFAINTKNGSPSYYIDFSKTAQFQLKNRRPEITLKNTKIKGLDGAYWLNKTASSFIMVSKSGKFSLHFKKDNVKPSCNKNSDTDIDRVSSIQVFPVPVKNQLTVNSLTPDVIQIEILDATGKKIQNFEMKKQSTVQLDVTDLAKGVYFVKTISEDNDSQILRIIK